ncbi:pirin family protein [Paenibacillus sp. 1P07SE]|uniref:pirin family protein n=1 Tax=Paenibacillus sp. 1P07SE TaxID=3132209 RepID=UPI0039A70DFE
MKARIIKPQDQAKGTFDGGKITEQKPIGFSGEGSVIDRLGPLFYWAWAHAEGPAEIGLHPHKGFEIITYVIQGSGHHRDTMGTSSMVEEGGAQLMQTGSGVSHAEAIKEPSELFQIWLEPNLIEAVKRTPSYSQYDSSDFSSDHRHGSLIKNVLGNGSPMKIETDAQMWDITIEDGATYSHRLSPNRALAGLAIRGNGSLEIVDESTYAFQHKDFFIVQAEAGGELEIRAEEGEVRLFLIEVPLEVEYALYRK